MPQYDNRRKARSARADAYRNNFVNAALTERTGPAPARGANMRLQSDRRQTANMSGAVLNQIQSGFRNDQFRRQQADFRNQFAQQQAGRDWKLQQANWRQRRQQIDNVMERFRRQLKNRMHEFGKTHELRRDRYDLNREESEFGRRERQDRRDREREINERDDRTYEQNKKARERARKIAESGEVPPGGVVKIGPDGRAVFTQGGPSGQSRKAFIPETEEDFRYYNSLAEGLGFEIADPLALGGAIRKIASDFPNATAEQLAAEAARQLGLLNTKDAESIQRRIAELEDKNRAVDGNARAKWYTFNSPEEKARTAEIERLEKILKGLPSQTSEEQEGQNKSNPSRVDKYIDKAVEYGQKIAGIKGARIALGPAGRVQSKKWSRGLEAFKDSTGIEGPDARIARSWLENHYQGFKQNSLESFDRAREKALRIGKMKPKTDAERKQVGLAKKIEKAITALQPKIQSGDLDANDLRLIEYIQKYIQGEDQNRAKTGNDRAKRYRNKSDEFHQRDAEIERLKKILKGIPSQASEEQGGPTGQKRKAFIPETVEDWRYYNSLAEGLGFEIPDPTTLGGKVREIAVANDFPNATAEQLAAEAARQLGLTNTKDAESIQRRIAELEDQNR